MATLQKFKLFATQCAAVNIPTQSPTTSPLLLRRRHRRKTLRMLLTRRPQIPDSDHQQITKQSSLNSPPSSDTVTASDASSIHRRLKLKDLFFSSSSTSPINQFRDDRDRTEPAAECDGIGPIRSDLEIIKPKAVRPVYQPFGCRNRLLLRKSWRPVLSTIDEIQA